MLVIADSGSTKCDWRIVSEDKSYIDCSSMGINPYFHNEDVIEAELRRREDLMAAANDVKALFFYGAGCSSVELKRTAEQGLRRIFPNAEIYVDHDLVAAAFAVYDDDPCIACILGTGSNSCHFDGDIVREEVPALAYILGDEGSGSYFGKKLLSDFLYKRLPDEMHKGLIDKFGLTKDIIIDRVYMKPHANVYLASFMKFITTFKSEPYVQEMIAEGIGRFLDTHVTCYRDFEKVQTHFIGSVAYYHEDTLREVATLRNINVGRIIKKPIEGLYHYHIKNYFEHISF
jgi:N-acetylglucosamine kinase-like BadF-type ATPase